MGIRTITVRKQFRTGELFKQLSRTELNCLNSSVQLARTVRTALSNWTELFEQFSSAQENCRNSSFELSWTVEVLVLKVPYRIARQLSELIWAELNCSNISVQLQRTVRTVLVSWTELFEQFGSVPKSCSNSSRELNWTVQTVQLSSKSSFERNFSEQFIGSFEPGSWAGAVVVLPVTFMR